MFLDITTQNRYVGSNDDAPQGGGNNTYPEPTKTREGRFFNTDVAAVQRRRPIITLRFGQLFTVMLGALESVTCNASGDPKMVAGRIRLAAAFCGFRYI